MVDRIAGNLEKKLERIPSDVDRNLDFLPNPDFDVQFSYNPSTDGDFFDWLERKNRGKNNITISDTEFPEPAHNRKTGVMNPYVLASVISMPKRKDVRGFPMGRSAKIFRQGMDDLVEAVNTYQEGSVTSYREIFDPARSPLYKPLKDTKALNVRHGTASFPQSAMKSGIIQGAKPVQSAMASHAAMTTQPAMHMDTTLIPRSFDTGVRPRQGGKYEGAGVDVGSGVKNVELQEAIDGEVASCRSACPGIRFGLDTAGVTIPAYCGIVTRPTTKIRRDLLNDPMQGICLDCYFMAALFSISGKYYPSSPPVLTADSSTGKYSISFYDTTASLRKIPQYVLPTFPLNASGQMLFAQQTPEFELWAALYEKAYAKFKGLASFDITWVAGATADDPNIGLFNSGDPVTAMTEICKLLGTARSDNNNAKRPSIFATANRPFKILGTTFNRSYDVLKAFDATSYNTVNFCTVWPTVAWTSESVQASPNTAIVPSHAYSILGLLDKPNAAGGTDNYIVLRNPWATKINPATDPNLATGDWTPESGLTLTFGRIADGIFGIRADAFDSLFAGIGWVQFSSLTS